MEVLILFKKSIFLRMGYFSVKDILEPKREPYVAFFVKIEMLILR